MWVSPNYRNTDITNPPTLDEKINLFEDRTIGWQLAIANRLVNGTPSSDGRPDANAVAHAGYATLHIVLSYFEMIGKYKAGFVESTQSARFFKEGVRDVFPDIGLIPQPVVDDLLAALYSGGRCGLYHGGMTDSRIILTGDLTSAMAYRPATDTLAINPHWLPPALLAHFRTYVSQLRNPANADLRTRFERRFDAETQPPDAA